MLEKVEAVAQEMKRNQFTVLLQLVGIVLPLTEEFYRNESEKKNKGEEKKNNKEEEKEKNKGEEEEKNKGEKKEKDVKENSSEESKKQTKDTHPNPFNMCGMPYFRDCLDWTKKVECGNPGKLHFVCFAQEITLFLGHLILYIQSWTMKLARRLSRWFNGCC